MSIIKKEFQLGDKNLFIETGKFALQADGSIMCGSGDTWVLCTVVFKKEASKDATYFPLSVTYIEKFTAFGKIHGGFVKREGKPTEKEILTGRLIDRSLRPMFPEGFYNEVQVICTLMSYDGVNEPETCAMIGSSAALKLAGLPMLNTIAGVKIAKINDKFIINPTFQEVSSKENKLDLFISSTKDSVIMVESQASELSESEMLDAIMLCQKENINAINAIENLVQERGYNAFPISHEMEQKISEIEKEINDKYHDEIFQAYSIPLKQERYAAKEIVSNKILENFTTLLEQGEITKFQLETSIMNVSAKIVRNEIIGKGKRIDGRQMHEIRPINCEVGVLPKVHGSALFMRGETQALVSVALGSNADGQLCEGIDGVYRENFMLHYNFPPFSVGETGRLAGPGRREIGHGKLAWKAINPIMQMEGFDYAVRVVSDILTCNGSSSMATVCGTSLALMHSGAPIKKAVAGIAMGLIKNEDNYQILTDIMADEDHLGDMDFKVAGTKDGITALQMDIKISGISKEILENAMKMAKEARMQILDTMESAISSSGKISENAPQIIKFSIPVNSIGDVIGKGGANIKQLSEEYSCKIDISDNGTISLYAQSIEKGEAARDAVLLSIASLEVGSLYDGVVTELKQFGAMVKLPGNKSGMIHISEISKDRVEKIDEYINVGDKLNVKYLGTDEKRRIKLSIKHLGISKNNNVADTNKDTNNNTDGEEIVNKRFASESTVEMIESKNSGVYSN